MVSGTRHLQRGAGNRASACRIQEAQRRSEAVFEGIEAEDSQLRWDSRD